jgi:hypothetical protein
MWRGIAVAEQLLPIVFWRKMQLMKSPTRLNTNLSSSTSTPLKLIIISRLTGNSFVTPGRKYSIRSTNALNNELLLLSLTQVPGYSLTLVPIYLFIYSIVILVEVTPLTSHSLSLSLSLSLALALPIFLSSLCWVSIIHLPFPLRLSLSRCISFSFTSLSSFRLSASFAFSLYSFWASSTNRNLSLSLSGTQLRTLASQQCWEDLRPRSSASSYSALLCYFLRCHSPSQIGSKPPTPPSWMSLFLSPKKAASHTWLIKLWPTSSPRTINPKVRRSELSLLSLLISLVRVYHLTLLLGWWRSGLKCL